MFKWITVLQLLFVIHIQLYMGEVTSKRTINVGTVLFNNSDSEKDCWTSESVLLLMSRSLMQMMLPEDCVSEYDKSNVDRLIPYLYSTLNTVRSLSKGSSQQMMVLSLSDVIGGYMRSQLLPSIKREYYQGNVAFGEIEQLYSLYAHLKSLLRTNGDGWRIPREVDIKLDDIPSLRISVKAPSRDICEHFDVGHPTERPYVITIPVPHLDNDIDPQSIAVPFRRQSVCSIQEASSADVVRKYYVDGMQCLLATTNEEGVMQFNVEMDAWMKKSVMPLLELEELYPAFGGVYRVFATVQRVRAIKRSASVDERSPLAVARDGDSNIPFLSVPYPQSTDSAVAVMKRLPIQQHPAFVASVRHEKVPEKPTNLKYSGIQYSEHLEETSVRVPVERTSGFKNGNIVTKSYVVHKNENSSESVSNKQSNWLFDSLSLETANGEASLDTPKIQMSHVFPANTEPLFLTLRPNTVSSQPLQSRSSFVPFYFHENLTHESKDAGSFYPFNALSNYLEHGGTHLFKNTPSLRSFSSIWTNRPRDSHDDITTLLDKSVNLLKNFHESVEPYIRNYSVSLPLCRSPSLMSSTLPDTSPKSYFFTKSKDAYFNVLPVSSNALKGYKIHYDNDKHPIHSQPPSMSSRSDASNITENTSLFESPLVLDNICSVFETKGSTFVSEPSAVSLFFGVPTAIFPYSPLPTSSYSDNVPSESSELSSVGSFPTSPTSLLVESTFPHSVIEIVSTSSPTPSKLAYIASSTALARQEVAHAKSNNSVITSDIKNQSRVSVNINSASFTVSQPSYDDKQTKIMRTSHLKGHNIQSKIIHEKSRFRFLKPFHITDSPFAKLGIVSSLHNHKGSGGSRKDISSFIRSNVKSTTVDYSLMVGIPNILLESPHLPNSPHSQNTFVNELTSKNALITNNKHLGSGINSLGNSISYSNNSYNDGALERNTLTLSSKSESINPNSVDTCIRTALITKRQPVPVNASLEASPKMFGETNNRSGSFAWKRSASKDLLTFPSNSHSDQTIAFETYVVPYGSVVSVFESGNNFLLSSILPSVANVKSYEEGKPDFLSMDLNYIDKNPEYESASSNLNIQGVSSDKAKTENRGAPQVPSNTDVPIIKLILKKADHSEVRTQSKENSKGSSLRSNNFLVNDNTIGSFTRFFTEEYNINKTLVTPKQATNNSEIILLGISSPEEESSRGVITSGIGGNKRKSNKLFTTRCNVTKNINSPVEKFLQMELEDDEVNKEIDGEIESEGSSKGQSTKFSEQNNNLDNKKMKYKNLLTRTQIQMKNLKTQGIAEHMKGKSEETEAKLSSNDILLNEKLHPSKETNYQKFKKKLFKPRPTKAKFQEYDIQPGNDCRKENVAYGNIESINKDNEYAEEDYDDDDEEEWKKERSSTGRDVTDGRRKLNTPYPYTVKSIYEEDPSRTKFPFIDTFMENWVKYAMSSLIVSPDLGILNIILMVILWVTLALCRCIKEQPSKTRHVRISQSEPDIKYTNYPFHKLMSSLSSFYRALSFRIGPRGNVSHVPLSKLRKEHPSKGFNSGGTTWTCECSPSVDAPCSTSVRLAEEGRNFDSIPSEFSDNSDLLRRLDEALNVIRAANTILSKPHSCPHLFPKQQTLSPPHTRSVPMFPSCRSPSEQTRPSSPYQSWVFREAFWPYPPPSSASGHSEDFERELPSHKRRYTSKAKSVTEPLQSDSDWPSSELETKLSSQMRDSSGAKAAAQPLQSDSDWPPEELERERPSQKRNVPYEDERYSLEPRVGTVCSQYDSDVSSCISIDIRPDNVQKGEKRPRKRSGQRKKCKECGLFISSPSSLTDDTSRDAG